VLTVSIHADPIRFYPFFWGYSNETGEGRGEGFNLNLPLPRGTGDAEIMSVLDTALAAVSDYAPEALVIALGLDAHESDPFRGMTITTAGFSNIAKALFGLNVPTVIVQEGGYLSDALAENLVSFMSGFQNT